MDEEIFTEAVRAACQTSETRGRRWDDNQHETDVPPQAVRKFLIQLRTFLGEMPTETSIMEMLDFTQDALFKHKKDSK